MRVHKIKQRVSDMRLSASDQRQTNELCYFCNIHPYIYKIVRIMNNKPNLAQLHDTH